jgi:hypothetical protein
MSGLTKQELEQFSDDWMRLERFAKRARRELRRTAYHEAGHAVFAIRCGIDFAWVAVRPLLPDQDWQNEAMDPFDYGAINGGGRIYVEDFQRQRHENLISTLACPVAQARFSSSRRVRVVGQDRQRADLCLEGSWCDDLKRVERDHLDLVRLLVDRHWAEIEAVASALIERRYLTFREVGLIIKSSTKLASDSKPPKEGREETK